MRFIFATVLLCTGLLGCNSLNYSSSVTYNRYDTPKPDDDAEDKTTALSAPVAASSPAPSPISTPAPPLLGDGSGALDPDFSGVATVFGPMPSKPLEPAAPPTPSTRSVVAVCPPYQTAKLDPIPALPYEELEKAGNDPAKIDQLERRHIEELRRYILKMRVRVFESQNRYVVACRNYMENQQR